jgi:hypothetical protein
MAFKTTHVDWYDDGSSTVHHKGDEDVKHGAAKTHDVLVSIQKHIGGKPGLPPVERYGEAVPKGGSKCANCEYLADDKVSCHNEDFIAWEGPDKPSGSSKIPGKIDEYCSIWWENGEGREER